jgi:NAD+ synthase
MEDARILFSRNFNLETKMIAESTISSDVLKIDAAAEVDRLTESIRKVVFRQFKRQGAVVGVSGGIDSSVVAFLCARALGRNRVVLVLMPEVDSSPDSSRLGRMVAETLGVRSYLEDISDILQGARCYERRDEAIQTVIPEYGNGWKSKIVLPSVSEQRQYAIFSLVAHAPDGTVKRVRLTPDAYLGVVAATNFKQRARKMIEYHYADRYHFAVAGTPNRLEYDQGFFVKNGDGSADFKPIAHLYKSQVYQLADYLGVPEEIQLRPCTTDTYSLEQSQEEFYFSLPLAQMDLCLYGINHGISAAEIAPAAGLTEAQAARVYSQIESTRAATRYLHLAPVLMERIEDTGIHAPIVKS